MKFASDDPSDGRESFGRILTVHSAQVTNYEVSNDTCADERHHANLSYKIITSARHPFTRTMRCGIKTDTDTGHVCSASRETKGWSRAQNSTLLHTTDGVRDEGWLTYRKLTLSIETYPSIVKVFSGTVPTRCLHVLCTPCSEGGSSTSSRWAMG